jgi:isopenicillin N synthase-like dioxygenase
MVTVPVIDLSPAVTPAGRRTVARAIDEACRETGFFTIVGHGVPEALIERTRAMAAEFFALPEAEKRLVARPPVKVSRGWFPFKDRSLSYTLGTAAPPDLQEAFAFGPEDASEDAYTTTDRIRALRARNIWPDRPEGFRDTMADYFAAMLGLGDRLTRLMALALGLDESYFLDKFRAPCSTGRVIRYPAQTGAPEDLQLRAGAHTDYGAVTFVRGDNVPGGLQIKPLNGDAWVEIARPEGGFVCNISDAMARWTNDRWKSTLHRVGNPPPEARGSDRISLVFFHMPDLDADIRCIPGCEGDGAKYPPVTFAEHYLGKLMKAGHGRTGSAGATPG